MLMTIIDDFRVYVSETFGEFFDLFVNIIFLFAILLFICAIKNLTGNHKNYFKSFMFGIFGFFILVFSFQLGNPFGISIINHGYSGISY